MSTAELKNKLKKKIDGLNQDSLLEELIDIIDFESDSYGVIKIPEEHKADLKVSLDEMDEGKTTSHHQVMKEFRDGLTS